MSINEPHSLPSAPGVTLDVASEFLLFEELRGAG
jgi:hypothetical protein